MSEFHYTDIHVADDICKGVGVGDNVEAASDGMKSVVCSYDVEQIEEGN